MFGSPRGRVCGEGLFVLARSVCLCLQEARVCVCVCVYVCVCGVWGRPGKVAGLSFSDHVDRRSLIRAGGALIADSRKQNSNCNYGSLIR